MISEEKEEKKKTMGRKLNKPKKKPNQRKRKEFQIDFSKFRIKLNPTKNQAYKKASTKKREHHTAE